MQYLDKIIPYLKDPLVLAGFVVFLFFWFCRYVIKRGIIPTLGRTQGYRALRAILMYGFILGLMIVLLGFGLKYRSLAEAEQQRAVSVLASELGSNRKIVSQLAANLETLVNVYDAVTRALRSSGIPVLHTMFPESNLRKGFVNPSPTDLATQALKEISAGKFDRNRMELRRAEVAGKQLVATIEKTQDTVASLADTNGRRYQFHDDAYRALLPILRRIDTVNVSTIGESYSDGARVRASYDVVVRNVQAYLAAVREFFTTQPIDIISLSKVLTAERLATNILVTFTPMLVEAGESLDKIERRLTESSRLQ